MTHRQIAALILAGMMGLFVRGRLRYDLVALLASLAASTVKPHQAFSGFSDDIVIIVGSALVVSAAVGPSGIIETAMNWLARRVTGLGAPLSLLVVLVDTPLILAVWGS
ncbi:SLC13 family permease [Paracoccus limosus]|uniref:SLC13 family permease n=1 Tax=Paracoccus limosus TaxID=913252 RepID=UPI001B8709F7|nr:SLC13 family permease [Paracoccus limosus]